MPNNQVEEIKQKIDIVSYIGERVSLKKSGRNFKGLCPFHGEKTPSFYVTAEMQIYKCFGCGKAGDIFNFLMDYEGLTFVEALDILAKKSGVVLTKREKTNNEARRERVLEILHLASEYYHFLLINHKVGLNALHYLKERGINRQSIIDFKLGYALENWQALGQYLKTKKGYRIDELVSAGLVISNQGRYYDRFRGRIMFPLTTFAGKIVGFSGRILDKNDQEAKYINSPETDFYHKSELLFGINQAKKAIKEKDRVVVVEGEFDVISSYQAGIKEVVAIKGSALTEEQALLIRRLTHQVILALDADEAGQEAIHRAIPVCEKQALNLRVLRMTGGKDPDELCQNNSKQFKGMINTAESVYAYLIDSAIEQIDVNTGEGKKKVTQKVMPELAKIEHAVEREFYVKKLALKLKVSENAIAEELSKTKKMLAVGLQKVETTAVARYSRREMLERQLLGLVLQSTKPKEWLGQVDEKWLLEPHLKRLFNELVKVTAGGDKGVIIFDRLPESMKILAREVYTLNINWLEETESNLSNLFEGTKSTLESLYGKQRLVALTKQITRTDLKEGEQDVLQQEYRQAADRLKEVETL